MVKLVAFDWNGTLFSDTFASLKGVNILLQNLNLPQINLRTYQNTFDTPLRSFFFSIGVSKDEFENNWEYHSNVFNTYYESVVLRIRTRAGTRLLLNWLKENKITSIILSNHRTQHINQQLKRLKIAGYFNKIVANSVIAVSLKKRNKKENLDKFLQDNNYLPKEVIIVGDTVEEVEAGKGLGAVTVAITQGSSSLSRLKQAKPDYIIHNLKDLIGIINKLNGNGQQKD